MRKIIAIAILALSLGGCATPFGTFVRNVETAISLGTVSVANPITPTRLQEIESTVQIVFIGLNAWKTSCAKGLIPPSCKDQIFTVQVYTRQIKPYLKQLRTFVRNNDQVNAMTVFNQLMAAIDAAKAQAATNGQNIGS